MHAVASAPMSSPAAPRPRDYLTLPDLPGLVGTLRPRGGRAAQARGAAVVAGPELLLRIHPDARVPPAGPFAGRLRLPSLGTGVDLALEWAGFSQENWYMVRTRGLAGHPAALRALSRTLLADGDATPFGLRRFGFKSPELPGLSIRPCLPAEYQEVLRLRLRAYTMAGKAARGAAPETMRAPEDARSTLMGAFFRGRLIASCAIHWPERASRLRAEALDLLGGAHGRSVPAPRSRLAEPYYFCADKEYLTAPLVDALMGAMFAETVRRGRFSVLAMSTEAMWPLYRKYGFVKTGLAAPVPALGNKVHHILYRSPARTFLGLGLAPALWRRNASILAAAAFRLPPRLGRRAGLGNGYATPGPHATRALQPG